MKKNTFAKTALLTALTLLAACTSKPEITTSTTYPVLNLYGDGGVNLICKITLTSGFHNLGVCEDMLAIRYFTVSYPREGVDFAFHKMNFPPLCFKGSNVRYKIVDPIPGSDTHLTSITAGENLPPNTEIVPGITTEAPHPPCAPIPQVDAFFYLQVISRN
jgi:hypothetical protein